MATRLDNSPSELLRSLNARRGFVTLGKTIPLGSLQARRARTGAITLYWRFNVTHGGKVRQGREIIGLYDPKQPPKSLKPNGNRFSLAAAFRRAEELAEAHQSKRAEGGLLAIKQAERKAREDAQAIARNDSTYTLSRLMSEYVDHLKRNGRSAYKDVRSITRIHIEQRSPAIAAKCARDVSPEDVTDILRSIHVAGKLRTANKARSYIRAAYELAKSARIDATVPAFFKEYGIKTNPAAETRVVSTSNGKPRTIRALSLDQLRTYWRLLSKLEGRRGAMLRFDLLTGGQRLDQLCRLAPEDIQADRITIYDGKGRGGSRPHVVPLIPAARKELDACATLTGRFAFTTDGGMTHVHGTTLSGWMNEAIKAASEDDRNALAGYTAKHIRSGFETALAAAGVSKEVRGRLQSHGISGVQDVHYNAHDYIAEKRRALEMLCRLLNARE